MKILVTGGAGFVGSHLVDALTEKHEVIIYENLGQIPEYLNSKTEFVREDIRNKAKLKKAIFDSEVIFHQAAMVGVGQSMYQIEKYIDVNTMWTAKLLDLLANIVSSMSKYYAKALNSYPST